MEQPGFSERFGLDAVDRYDGEIAFTDSHVGELLDSLTDLGFERNTLVIVVSDHGEAFGEHGLQGHRLTLYDEELRVALMIRAPGHAPGRVAEPVSVVDVAPTALELLDVPPPTLLAGSSLMPVFRGEALSRPPILAEMYSFLGNERLEAVIADSWKLVTWSGREPRLYDLAADPDELEDVAAEHPSVVQTLLRQRAVLMAEAQRRGEAVDRAPEEPLPVELQRRLEALGYIDPGAPGDSTLER